MSSLLADCLTQPTPSDKEALCFADTTTDGVLEMVRNQKRQLEVEPPRRCTVSATYWERANWERLLWIIELGRIAHRPAISRFTHPLIYNTCNYSGRHHLDATNKMILYPLPHKSIEKKFFLLDSD